MKKIVYIAAVLVCLASAIRISSQTNTTTTVTNYFAQPISIARYSNGNAFYFVSSIQMPTTNRAPEKPASFLPAGVWCP